MGGRVPQLKGARPALAVPADGFSREIVAAAVELFSERGYHGTSVNDILKRTAISKGGFYHHFESKEQILVSIHDAFIDYELATTEHILNSGEPATDQLKGLIRAHMESIASYQTYMTVFLQQVTELSDGAFDEIRKKRRRYQDAFETVIKASVADGSFSPILDVKLQAQLLIGMLNGTVLWYRPGTWSIATITQNVTTMFFNGLLIDKAAVGRN